MLEQFDACDAPFVTWLESNVDGYVANTERRNDSSLFRIHRSECRSLRQSHPAHREGAYTAYDYIKICSDSLSELKDWASRQRRNATVVRCDICNP